ncbi:MAG: hypothetical protein L0Y44_12430 [Phycisphaerales bacterium]|nr:hypothetical protein [Phycisphaerales bacterium]MCI0631448.1 hypothetical protein [Phycisphaerales bacterium]MCI0676603.1 hypothetical protein [Phycisphaerales bacterium]
MLDRAACERRVYRLATLLTGDPVAATKVIEQVVDAQPDLRDIDSAHMDRLTVLRSREIKPAILAHDLVPNSASEALASLPPQGREAWVLAHVYQVPGREIARAMDCSFTATKRHLEGAEAAMLRRLGDRAPEAGRAIRAYSLSLDVPRFYRLERFRRRQTRIAVLVIIASLVALALAGIMILLSRPMGS